MNSKNSWIMNFLNKDTDHILYWISIVTIVFTAVMMGIVYLIVLNTGRTELMECSMKRLFGIPCPGCGGTRSLISLFRGDIVKSIYYNAFATYGCIVYLIYFISQTLQRCTRGRIQGIKFKVWYLYLGIVILVVQYVLKLIIPEYII